MKDWYYMFKGLSHGRDLASSSSLLANVLDGLYLQKPNLNSDARMVLNRAVAVVL
jgi:hypothetical protein